MGSTPFLQQICAAHGGLERWRRVKAIAARFRTGGWALKLKGHPRAFQHTTLKIFPEQPYAKFNPYPSAKFQGGLYREKVWIEDIKGEMVAERIDPRKYLEKFRRRLWWDSLDTLYFGAYAMWNYLTLPFLLMDPEIAVGEPSDWQEGKETWQKIDALFPPYYPTHCQHQSYYFDEKGLLRRHDYTAEVIGRWAKASNYSWNHREFDGIVFPTTRRVWPRFGKKPFRGITLVALDIEDIKIEWND